MNKDKVLTIAAMLLKGHKTGDINGAIDTAIALIKAVDERLPESTVKVEGTRE